MISVRQLYKLQKLNDEFRDNDEKILKLDNADELKKIIEESEKTFSRKKEEIQKLKFKTKDMELNSQSQSDQRKALEKKLYDGKNNNPKELCGWQKEIEQINSNIIKLDDHILENMQDIEEKEENAKKYDQKINELRNDYKNKVEEYNALREKLINNSNEIKKMIEDHRAQMDTESIEIFDRIYDQKDHLAVVKLEEKSCGACYRSLPEDIIKKVFHREFQLCNNCGRILIQD